MSLLNGLLGGMLLGTGGATLMLGAGEIMGFSGVMSPMLKNPFQVARDPNQHWKIAFLTAYMLAANVFFLPYINTEWIETAATATSPLAYALSGLLTGFGTKLGNGCTTGHGICGMPRFSKRSLTAVLSFMSTAVATTVLTSPEQPTGQAFVFLRNGATLDYLPWVPQALSAFLVGLTLYGAFVNANTNTNKETKKSVNNDNKLYPSILAGIIASAGLTFSTMVYPHAVQSFLNFGGMMNGTWNPTLMAVMSGGLLTSFLAYQFVPGQHALVQSCPKLTKPLCGDKFGMPTNTTIDWKLLTGASIFGIGWGISGLCPGSVLLLAMTGMSGIVLQWLPGFYVGNRIAEYVQGQKE